MTMERVDPRRPHMLDFVEFHNQHIEAYQQTVADLTEEDAFYWLSYGVDPQWWGLGSSEEGMIIPIWFSYTVHERVKPGGELKRDAGGNPIKRLKSILRGAKIRRRDTQNPSASKYRAIPGSSTGGPYPDWNLCLVDGTNMLGRPEPYVIIVEAEKDAMMLSQMGEAAVAWRPDATWDLFIGQMTRPYEQIVILRDNDSAGQTIAKRIKAALERDGRTSGVLVTYIADEGVKQVSDLFNLNFMREYESNGRDMHKAYRAAREVVGQRLRKLRERVLAAR